MSRDLLDLAVKGSNRCAAERPHRILKPLGTLLEALRSCRTVLLLRWPLRASLGRPRRGARLSRDSFTEAGFASQSIDRSLSVLGFLLRATDYGLDLAFDIAKRFYALKCKKMPECRQEADWTSLSRFQTTSSSLITDLANKAFLVNEAGRNLSIELLRCKCLPLT